MWWFSFTMFMVAAFAAGCLVGDLLCKARRMPSEDTE